MIRWVLRRWCARFHPEPVPGWDARLGAYKLCHICGTVWYVDSINVERFR